VLRRKLDFVVAAKLILLVDVRGEEVDVSPRLVDVRGEDAFSRSTTSGRLGTEFKRSGRLPIKLLDTICPRVISRHP
jgi:hypothetical protein